MHISKGKIGRWKVRWGGELGDYGTAGVLLFLCLIGLLCLIASGIRKDEQLKKTQPVHSPATTKAAMMPVTRAS